MVFKQRSPQWLIAVGLTVLTAIVFIFIWWFVFELRPVNHQAKTPVAYQLAPSTSVTTMAQQLEQEGIIRNHTVFVWYVTVSGLRRGLQAGSYELSPADSTPQIASTLGHGRVTRNVVAVPEGTTVSKIGTLAQTKGISADDFQSALTTSYPNAFLTGRPEGDTSLEGYLFPDSYEIVQPPRAKTLISQMLNNFQQKVTAANLPQEFEAEGLTLHQGVTLASIVEKEVPGETDRAMVAQVFMNRIKAGMPLQSDVTVDYATRLTGQPFSVDLRSPYNTYINKGLPPGPICNPGIGAMKAVAQPQPNDYLYFLAGKDGKTHYSHTFAEHQQNIEKYLK